jgi:ABC transport system ATP-binding/permease protein
LDENKSVLDNVGQGRDTITVNGKPRNLVGYLEDFLFTRDRVTRADQRPFGRRAQPPAAGAPVCPPGQPAGAGRAHQRPGYRNPGTAGRPAAGIQRHAAAGQPRPRLLEQPGHQHLVLDGSGQVREYVGGYDDWLRQSAAEQAAGENGPGSQERGRNRSTPSAADAGQPANASRKLSYKEQRAREAQKRELEELPGRIEALEAEVQRLTAAMAEQAFYQQTEAEITRATVHLKTLEEELHDAYAKWEALEALFG